MGMAATSISRREEVRKRVGVFSPEILSRIAAPVRRPSNSSERDVSFAHEGFECPSVVTAAVTDVAARIEPAIRVAQGKEGENPATKGRRIQACSRDLLRSISSRDDEKEKERTKERTWAKFGRRAVLKWKTPG